MVMLENDTNPVDAIKAVDRLRFDAMVEGNATLLEQMLGEDLTYIHTTGAVDTKATFLASLRAGTLRYLSIQLEGVEVRIYGAAAVVTGRVDMQVALDGKEAAFPARFTSVYAKRHDRWLLVAWQSTRLPLP
jgi:ketosteroid isomerase-like protein